MQHVPTRLMEQTVQKNAVQTAVGQTTTVKTSRGFVFLVVMMDIKEKNARKVSKVDIRYLYTVL